MPAMAADKSRSYLAFDLGAGSGRLMIGRLGAGRLELAEVHRFPNRLIQKSGRLRWDLDALLGEVDKSLSICAERFTHQPKSIGVDTWGVDFGILNESGELADFPISYRDPQVDGSVESFLAKVPR